MMCLFSQVKRWEIQLDIAAPQIILPEKFVCDNTNMIVLDLGHIKFHNTASGTPGSEHATVTEGMQTVTSSRPECERGSICFLIR